MHRIVFKNQPLAGEIKVSALTNVRKGMSFKLTMFSYSSPHNQQEICQNGRMPSTHEIHVQIERSNYHRRPFNEWPRPSSSIDTAQIRCIAHYGLLKRLVVDDDFQTTRKSEVQVWQQTLWGHRILRQYHWIKFSDCRKIYPRLGESGSNRRSFNNQGIRRLF